jgi:hypothetical protein
MSNADETTESEVVRQSEPKLGWNERSRRFAGGTEILSGRVRRALERHIHGDETVRFCLKGDFDHTLVALDDRLLIIKAGVFAGTTFGARVASIDYKDITGIEVNTGLLNCVVEVATPSYPAVGKKSAWFGGRTSKRDLFNRDPHTESNTIPVVRPNLKKWEPHLKELRALIAEAKREPTERQPPPVPSLGGQLKELAELHQSGVLSDEEFAQAKARLLAED